MEVNIVIDELILDGFDFNDHLRIGRAVEQELERLVGENGLPRGLASQGDLSGTSALSFNAPSDMNPTGIGRGAARSIYKALVTQRG